MPVPVGPVAVVAGVTYELIGTYETKRLELDPWLRN